MHFKLIITFVEDAKTEAVMQAAREAGATGCTVINNARGEGLEESKTFFGLTLQTQRATDPDDTARWAKVIRDAHIEVRQ